MIALILLLLDNDTLVSVLFACASIALACVVFGGWMLATAQIVHYLQYLGMVS